MAEPGIAPMEWQSPAPRPLFGSKFAPVGDSHDLQRILALPRRPVLDLASAQAGAMQELITRRYSLGRPADSGCECRRIDPKLGCITELLPVQAWSLYEMGLAGGLLAQVPVGGGKTIIGMLAVFALGVRSAALLVPPGLVEQLIRNYKSLSQHFVVPNIEVHDGTWSNRVRPWPDGTPKPLLHVVPYSILQLPRNSDMLERRICPEAIISDECDKLKDLSSATTNRVVRYFGTREETKFCGWTGSLSNASIVEYHHLAALALRFSSPLPLDVEEAESWGRALDAIPNRAPPGALLQLCAPGEDVRSGFRRRLAETRGVITVGNSDVEQVAAHGDVRGTGAQVQLVVRERPAPAIPREVEDMLRSVREWVRPDGEELIDAMQVAKCANEVACGLYYYWYFPNKEPESLIKEWLEARKWWNKELRKKLQAREEYLDSEFLCKQAAMRHWGDRPKKHDRPEWASVHWRRWRDIAPRVRPKTRAMRVSDYLVQDAAAWAGENRGIVWYEMVEFGRWIAEVSGMTMHTGGPKAARRIAEETGERSILASISSHGRGRDGLQRLYDTQLIANVSSSATRNEQLLGRLHRRGQTSAVVTADLYAHTPELRKTIQQALRRAAYVEGTLGAAQKLAGAWQGEFPDEDEVEP